MDEKGSLLFSKITGLTISDLEKGSNFTLNVAKNIKNMFWKEVLAVWRKIQRKHIPNTVEDVLKSCIWESDVFKTTKKDINLKTWCKAGIYYVNDLVEEGQFMTLRVRAFFHKTVRVCHVYYNFKIGFTCRITVIFGTLKDGSLLINTLASNICFSYRNMFQNGVDALSKIVDAFVSKSSKFHLVRIIR